MKMKKLVSLALVLTCALTMTACGSKKEENNGETKEETETLIMATNAEFPPYEYYEGDDIVGIDAEFAAAIAEKLGMELKIEDMAFDSILSAVQSGKADLGVAGITVDDTRKKQVDFTDTYYTGRQVIIVTEGSTIASPDEYVEEDYAMAVNKGNDELLEKVNAAIKELKEDGTFDEIISKYITD